MMSTQAKSRSRVKPGKSKHRWLNEEAITEAKHLRDSLVLLGRHLPPRDEKAADIYEKVATHLRKCLQALEEERLILEVGYDAPNAQDEIAELRDNVEAIRELIVKVARKVDMDEELSALEL